MGTMSEAPSHPAAPAASTTEQLKQLTADEKKLVEELRQDVHSIVKEHAHLQHFCSDWTYVRYLRARSWNLQKASKMLKATLEWRISYKPHEVTWDQVASEATTGKTVILDQLDKEGHPVVLLRPRNQNTKDAEGQIKFTVYTLEHASRICDKNGVGKMVWLVDYEGYSMHNAPPVKTSLTILNILQNHYPERLGRAINFHAPTIFWMSWKCISPFIDPVTYKKLVFVNKGPSSREQMEQWFDMTQVEEALGGDVKAGTWDVEKYSKNMITTDEEIQRELAGADVVADKIQVGEVQQQVESLKVSAADKAEEAPVAVTASS